MLSVFALPMWYSYISVQSHPGAVCFSSYSFKSIKCFPFTMHGFFSEEVFIATSPGWLLVELPVRSMQLFGNLNVLRPMQLYCTLNDFELHATVL